MKFKDKWLACVTLGFQTFRTQISDQLSSSFSFLFLSSQITNVKSVVICLELEFWQIKVKVSTFSEVEYLTQKVLIFSV